MRNVALDVGGRKIAVCEVRDGQVVHRCTVSSLEMLEPLLGPDRPPARVAVEACAEAWAIQAELDANPQLVRSMSVQPPRGLGRVRVLEIDGVDLQPCGGTHVANTAEVGGVVVTKIEKKSAMTRRVVLGFA